MRIAHITAAAGLALALGAAAFAARDGRPADVALAAALAAFLLAGALLPQRRIAAAPLPKRRIVAALLPERRIAALLLAEGLVWELALLFDGAHVAVGALDWLWRPLVAGIPLLLLLFPDGRPPSRRWWPVAWLTAAAMALPALLPAAMLAALASLAVRYRRAGALERASLRWFAAAAALIALALTAAEVVDNAYLNVLPLAALPVAIAVAQQRFRPHHLETLGLYLTAATTLGGWRALVAALPLAAAALRRKHHPQPEPEGIVVRTLGGFDVLRDGEPVTWPSKKARTLFKILVARRGQPVPREELMELLWPGEDPAKLRNRLSVALSAIRKAAGSEAIRADADAVALGDVTVDVERVLVGEEPAHAGDFLPEDRYADWASDLREAYAAALRARADVTADDGSAVRAYLRLIEHDPWDVAAHEGLIARLERAGRHGEAIRRRRDYIRAMAEIGVQAGI